MRYLFGAMLVIIGFLQVWFTDAIIRNFGYIPWAEQKIGNGGTWTFHKACGVLLILAGFIVASGQIFDILEFIFVR